MFVNGKEIFKFKADNKNVHFPTQFFLESISNGFSNTESREVPLNTNVYHFSVIIDLNSIELKYYPFMISLDKCTGSCNVLSPKTRLPKEKKI